MSRNCLIVLIVVGSLFTASGLAASQVAFTSRRVTELTESLDDLLNSRAVPGLSAVLVGPRGEDRFISLGKANLQSGVWVGPDTRFRVGEIAETFLALGLLRIAAAGKLDIQADVGSLIPDLTITNPYKQESPIRLDNLMEQTSGLQDMPLWEYALRRETSKSVLDTLQRNEAELVARWRPGLYALPSTLGAMLAVRILETQTSAQDYATWMTREVFQPLGVRASFWYGPGESFPDDLAVGYLPEGSPVFRPGGADLWPVLGLTASARDLQRLLRLLLNRGRLADTQWLPESSIERMETPSTSISAQQGLRVGDGFGLRTFLSGGFVFYGFAGSVDGGWACFRYLPGDGLGYALMMNGGSRGDFESAEHLLSEFCTDGLKQPQPLFSDLPEYRIAAVSGYYRPVTPRWTWLSFWDRIAGVLYIQNAVGKLEVDRLEGPAVELFPVTDRRFRAEGEPLPTVLFFRIGPGRAGMQAFSEYLQGNYVRASGLRVWVERIVAVFALIFSAIWVIAILVRLISSLFGRGGSRPGWLLILFPTLALGCLAAGILPLLWLPGPLVRTYGVADFWSVSLFVLTILFAVAVAGALTVTVLQWKAHHGEALWSLSLVVSALYLTILIYLGYWGLIGFRTWQS
jgi:CubicO group peptidase (beta-lactamase class C family)